MLKFVFSLSLLIAVNSAYDPGPILSRESHVSQPVPVEAVLIEPETLDKFHFDMAAEACRRLSFKSDAIASHLSSLDECAFSPVADDVTGNFVVKITLTSDVRQAYEARACKATIKGTTYLGGSIALNPDSGDRVNDLVSQALLEILGASPAYIEEFRNEEQTAYPATDLYSQANSVFAKTPAVSRTAKALGCSPLQTVKIPMLESNQASRSLTLLQLALLEDSGWYHVNWEQATLAEDQEICKVINTLPVEPGQVKLPKHPVHLPFHVTLPIQDQLVVWTQLEGPVLTPIEKSSPTLSFKADSMQPGTQYTFQGVVAEASVTYSVTWRTNLGPACTVSPNGQLMCDDQDSEDLPLQYSYELYAGNYRLPNELLALPVEELATRSAGPIKVVVTICDSLESCIVKRIQVTHAARQLQEEEETIDIIDEFNTATESGDDDIVLMQILAFAEQFDYDAEAWAYLLQQLDSIASSTVSEDGQIDEAGLDAMVAAALALLDKNLPGSEEDFIIEAFIVLEYVLTNTEFSMEDELMTSCIEVFAELVNTDNASIYNAALNIQALINDQKTNDWLPNESLEITGSDQGSLLRINRLTVEDVATSASFDFTLADGDYQVTIGGVPGDGSDLIDIELFVIPKTNSSASISLEFYLAGSYNASTLELVLEETRSPLDTSSLPSPINVTLPFVSDSTKTYAVYVLSDDAVWEQDNSISLSLVAGMATFTTSHATSFKILEAQDGEGGCDELAIPVYLMAIVLLLGIIWVAFAWYLNFKQGSVLVPQAVSRDEDIIKSPEKGGEEPSGELPPLSFAASFCLNHLVIGQLRRYYVSRPKRAVELVVQVLLHLVLTGLILMAFEDPEEETGKDHSDAARRFDLSLIVLLVAYLLNCIVELLMFPLEKHREILSIISWVLLGVLAVVSVVVTCVLSLDYCEGWNEIWGVIFAFSLMLDLVVLQSITSLVKVLLFKNFSYKLTRS